uniref:Actin related protein 1A n=2 Tax=Neognathae TaxID=8825 RepID=A0A8B9DLB0_ANSCY
MRTPAVPQTSCVSVSRHMLSTPACFGEGSVLLFHQRRENKDYRVRRVTHNKIEAVYNQEASKQTPRCLSTREGGSSCSRIAAPHNQQCPPVSLCHPFFSRSQPPPLIYNFPVLQLPACPAPATPSRRTPRGQDYTSHHTPRPEEYITQPAARFPSAHAPPPAGLLLPDGWLRRLLAMESYDVIANQPVVIDNGSGVIKAGFAGDQIPKYCFPNYVGRPKHVRVMAGALEGDIFIGPKAEEHRGLLSIRYPMEHGIVKDWNDMERIWQYVYSKDQLQTFSEEHPVLLTEAPLNPRKNRERAAEVFFETFNVPALFISMQAVLSLYATGRTTGVVLDSGDGVTHAVPIYEGFAMPHSIMRIDIAGRDVSRFLRLYLRKEGYDFHTTSEFEIVKTIKERACYLSINPQKDETLETEKAQYYLPDGSTIEIGPARFRAPELLFRPDLIGEECEGLHEVLVFAIQKSDMDLRRTLFSNIVLSGGSTLFKGFGDRLLSEVKKLAPKDVKIRISAPQERLYSTWIGGSILASLDTFKKMWVSKKEYEEDGARAIHRKTF